jgi:hypothetical protein
MKALAEVQKEMKWKEKYTLIWLCAFGKIISPSLLSFSSLSEAMT